MSWFQVEIYLDRVLGFPLRLITLPLFVKRYKAEVRKFKIGDHIRYVAPEMNSKIKPVVCVSSNAAELFPANVLGRDLGNGRRELKEFTFIETTAEHIFFVLREPFKISKILMEPNAIKGYLMGQTMKPVMWFNAVNENVKIGPKETKFIPSDAVEKI